MGLADSLYSAKKKRGNPTKITNRKIKTK